MDRRTRLFVFPGGVLEVYDDGADSDDGSLYLELFLSDADQAADPEAS